MLIIKITLIFFKLVTIFKVILKFSFHLKFFKKNEYRRKKILYFYSLGNKTIKIFINYISIIFYNIYNVYNVYNLPFN